MERLRMVVSERHVEKRPVVKSDKIHVTKQGVGDVGVPGGAPVNTHAAHDGNHVETDQVVAMVRGVVEIAPPQMGGVGIEPEFREPGQDALGAGQIAAHHGLAETIRRVQHQKKVGGLRKS
ncbi:hypothetical protein JCM33374_g6609 [Metschnikowia sp. JCM 33374]|nr:hypothetical protein JCM33374_g6609 [Metschnikowia sp. JCM 33374]